MIRVMFDQDGKLTQEAKAENSIFLWYEFVEAVLEYAPDKLIAALRPCSFLIIEDWFPTRHLKQV